MKGSKLEKGVPVTKGTRLPKGEKIRKSQEELLEELLTRRADMAKSGGEFMSVRAIGEHVIELLKAGTDLGLEPLLTSLRAAAERSPSARGDCPAEQDIDRQTAEFAIRRLLEAAGRGVG
jgi:hypothetical protein